MKKVHVFSSYPRKMRFAILSEKKNDKNRGDGGENPLRPSGITDRTPVPPKKKKRKKAGTSNH